MVRFLEDRFCRGLNGDDRALAYVSDNQSEWASCVDTVSADIRSQPSRTNLDELRTLLKLRKPRKNSKQVETEAIKIGPKANAAE